MDSDGALGQREGEVEGSQGGQASTRVLILQKRGSELELESGSVGSASL